MEWDMHPIATVTGIQIQISPKGSIGMCTGADSCFAWVW